MKSLLGVLALSLLLAGCTGPISSVSIPSAAPWSTFATVIASPYNDLTAQPVGMVATANIAGGVAVVACKSNQGKFYTTNVTLPTTDPSTWDQAALCNAQAAYDIANITPTPVITNVAPLGIYYLWELALAIDPTTFTSGGVEVTSDSVGTLFAVSFNKGGTALKIGAGVSQGALPGPARLDTMANSYFTAEWGGLAMTNPAWSEFGTGCLYADGSHDLTCTSTTSKPVAVCQSGDLIAFKNDVITGGTFSFVCGNVPVNLTLIGGFSTVGSCIDTTIHNNCTGLTGQNRSACVQAQISVCHAAFNVPGMPS